MRRLEDRSIILIEPDENRRRQAPAPTGFNWLRYDETIRVEGRSFRYVGTVEGTPHYLRAEGSR